MINQFSGGMNKDFHPSNIQPGEYIEAWNAVHNSVNNGNLYNLSNEEGFSVFSDFKIKRPNNIIIGMYPINGRIIVFSITIFDTINYKTSSSEIGYILDGVYKEVVNDINPDYYQDQNGLKIYKPTQLQIDTYSEFYFLNFDINYKIDIEARINFDGNIIVYWTEGVNIPKYLDLDIDYTQTSNQISSWEAYLLIITAPLRAKVRLNEIQDTGGLIVPGVYQFAVRYKLDDSNKTTFGFVSNPIPVVDEKESELRNKFDGIAYNYPLQVNKSIKLDITNLDQNFDKFELIVIYYTGSSSNFNAAVFKEFKIDSDSKQVVFDGQINDVVLLDELSVQPVDYLTAKHIIQKDGRVFLSNLSTGNLIDMQPIANKLLVKYTINEDIKIATQAERNTSDISYPSNEDFYIVDPKTDYKKAMNTHENKSYQRDEVYSIGIMGINNRNQESFVAHIPAQKGLLFPFLQVYESPFSFYPDKKGYKDKDGNSLDGEKLRFHKFPSLKDEPHTQYDPLTKLTTIRVMGFEITNLQSVLDEFPEIRDELKEIIIVRQPRSEINNRSIYAQGIVHRCIVQKSRDENQGLSMYSENMLDGTSSATKWDTGDFVNNGDYYSEHLFSRDIFLRVDPFCDNLNIGRRGIGSYVFGSGTYSLSTTNPGLVYTLGNKFTSNQAGFPAAVATRSNGGAQFESTQNVPYCAFYAPETIFGTLGIISSDYFIQQDLLIESFDHTITSVDGMGPKLGSETLTGGFVTEARAGYHMLMHDYHTVDKNQQVFNSLRFNIELQYKIESTNGVSSRSIGTGQILSLPVLQKNISINGKTRFASSGSEELVLLQIDRNYDYNTPIQTQHCFEPIVQNAQAVTSPNKFNLENGGSLNPDKFILQSQGKNQRRLISTLRRDNSTYSQFGELDQSRYIYIDSFKLKEGLITNKKIFNGDVFISKFYYQSSIALEMYYGVEDSTQSIEHLFDFKDAFTGAKNGHNLRGGHYFYVESEINCDYRHRPVNYVDPLDPGSWLNGPTYYPKQRLTVDTDGPVMSVDPEFGNSNGYNTQYSKQNDTRIFFLKPLDFQNVTTFQNRTIYSEQYINGEIVDKNRIFLVNNFQETAKNKGEVTGQFIHLNTLYLHTERSIFKTFVNQANIISGSQQEITLGNGGVFNNPPQEIYPLQSGHAGLIHKDTGVHTPFGYFFMDYHNKKVFLFGENLEEVSQTGMFNWFKSNIKEIQNNIANPNGSGAIAFYDPDNRRYVLSVKFNENEYKSLSFSLLSKKWVSFHSYYPTVVIASDQEVYSSSDKTNGIYLHNSGDYGIYYDQLLINLFVIEFCINEGKLISKVYDSLQVVCESLSENDKLDMLDFFNSIKCYTNNQETDLTELKVLDNNDYTQDEFEFNVRKVNNQFQLKIPLEKESEARLRSKYMIVKFEYKNSKNLYFTLMEIISKIRLSTR